MSEDSHAMWLTTTKQLDDSVRIMRAVLDRLPHDPNLRVLKSLALRLALEDVRQLFAQYIALASKDGITEKEKAHRNIGVVVRRETIEDDIAEAVKALL